MEDQLSWVAAAIVVSLMVWRQLKFKKGVPRMKEAIKNGAVVLDVRSPKEYAAGHHVGSVNIPLQELADKADKLDRKKTIIVCCASGARSARALSILKEKGFNQVENIGPWTNLRGC